jgi:hypothetical protein
MRSSHVGRDGATEGPKGARGVAAVSLTTMPGAVVSDSFRRCLISSQADGAGIYHAALAAPEGLRFEGRVISDARQHPLQAHWRPAVRTCWGINRW